MARNCACLCQMSKSKTTPTSPSPVSLVAGDMHRGPATIRRAPSLAVGDRERPHRKTPHPPHLHGHGKKPEPAVGKLSQPAQMLHDRNAGAEQQRVGGPSTVRRVVDVAW